MERRILIPRNTAIVAKKINRTVNTVGCFYHGNIGQLNEERAEEYVIVPPLTDELGNCTWTNQETESMWAEWFMVTSKCKYPEIAVRFADYFYSTEGTYTALYGPEGEDNLWYYNEEGKVVFTDWVNREVKKYEYTPGPTMPYYMSAEFYELEQQPNEDDMDLKEQIQRRNTAYQIEVTSKVVPKNAWPKVKQSLSGMKTFTAIKARIPDPTQWRWDFLTGAKSLENEWDTYIQNLKKQGIDDYIRVQQESYDSYIKWLEQ